LPKSGVYQIRHIASGAVYVGSTAHFAGRFSVGIPLSAEARAKVSAFQKTQVHTAEWNAKVSAAAIRRETQRRGTPA
jgi:hypothetical protein